MPVSLLPTTRGRAISVAPSATVWARAAATSPADMAGRAVLAAGPRLAAADEEVAALAARHPHATRLTGVDATVAAVAPPPTVRSWVHLAAHGRLRTDNPLFSSLEFSDGPLTVYDLSA